MAGSYALRHRTDSLEQSLTVRTGGKEMPQKNEPRGKVAENPRIALTRRDFIKGAGWFP